MPRPLLPSLLAVLAACAFSSSYTYWSTGEAIVEASSGHPVWVAWWHDGQLLGAEAADHPDFPLREFVRDLHGPIEDHPELQRWRQQLEQVRDAERTDAPLDRLLDRAAGLPFSAVVEGALDRRLEARPHEAELVLDRMPGIDVRDRFAERLVRAALGADVAADDDRIAGWLRAMLAADHEDAAAMLALAPRAGRATAFEALARIDDFGHRESAGVFRRAAAAVAADGVAAPIILRAVDELPANEADGCLLALLQSDSSASLAYETLRQIEDRLFVHRLELFLAALPRAMRAPAGHQVIVAAVGDLPFHERLSAMTSALHQDGADAGLAAALIGRVDDLPFTERAGFVDDVLSGPFAADTRVTTACRRALGSLPHQQREALRAQLDPR